MSHHRNDNYHNYYECFDRNLIDGEAPFNNSHNSRNSRNNSHNDTHPSGGRELSPRRVSIPPYHDPATAHDDIDVDDNDDNVVGPDSVTPPLLPLLPPPPHSPPPHSPPPPSPPPPSRAGLLPVEQDGWRSVFVRDVQALGEHHLEVLRNHAVWAKPTDGGRNGNGNRNEINAFYESVEWISLHFRALLDLVCSGPVEDVPPEVGATLTSPPGAAAVTPHQGTTTTTTTTAAAAAAVDRTRRETYRPPPSLPALSSPVADRKRKRRPRLRPVSTGYTAVGVAALDSDTGSTRDATPTTVGVMGGVHSAAGAPPPPPPPPPSSKTRYVPLKGIILFENIKDHLETYPHDVVGGKGDLGNRNGGDIAYRNLCMKLWEEYKKESVSKTTPQIKLLKELSRRVIDEIQDVRGGRFLEKVTYGTLQKEGVLSFDDQRSIDDPDLVYGWREKSPKKTKEKVKQHLREQMPRRSSPLTEDDVKSYYQTELCPTPPERIQKKFLPSLTYQGCASPPWEASVVVAFSPPPAGSE